ncbi:MAG: DUF3857 domain-containing protein [Victivallales bacterium]|nr:DUF3857 domain-containing protein [Victivallales bacterium]
MKSLACSIFAFACILTLTAQETPLAWDTPNPQLLNTEQLFQVASRVNTVRFPDADEVQLDRKTFIRYQEDGTWFQVMDMASKVLTEKGVEENRVIPSWYTANTSRAKISLVQLLKANGTVVDIDLTQNTSEQIDDSSMSSNIYDPNHKVIKVTVPGLEQGDTLRVVMVDELLKPRVPNSFSDIFTLEGTAPILHESVCINAPTALPLRSIVVKSPVGRGPVATQTEEGNRIHYQWEVHDVPQAFAEPEMPQMGQYVQRLLVSTFQDWGEVSRWYWKLCQPRLTVTPAMQEMVNSLVGDATDFDAVLRRVFDFVSSKVRYMGITIEENAPGYEPHDVSRTFEDRAGVCRDKAALLVAMLRAAGLEAYPVLIHVGQPKDEEVPLPFFNHAITAVRAPNSHRFILMDSTAENTRDLFPAYLNNLNYLVATPEGEPLGLSEIAPYTENLVSIRSIGEVTQEGTLHLNSDLTFLGINDNAYRGSFLRITPEQRRLYIERLLTTLFPSAQLERFTILPEDLQNLAEPLRIKISFSAPKYLVTALNADGTPDQTPGRAAMLELPRLAARFGLINYLFDQATLEKRRFPFKADYACGVEEQITLTLPQTLRPEAIPEYGEVDTDTLLWQRNLVAQPGRIFFSSLYANHKVLYTPSEYQQLKQALKTFEVEDQKRPVFTFVVPTQAAEVTQQEEDAPDEVYLEDRTVIEVDSPAAWTNRHTVRMQVLTYNGVKNNSDLKWSYNDATDAPELVYARVINPEDGSAHEVPPEMIHRMDASWVASAPRYSPGKTLVVNLPGVHPGCIIEYEILHHITNRNFFSVDHVFRGASPAQHRSLRVVVPKSLNLRQDFFPRGFLNCGEENAVKVKYDREKLPNDRIAHIWEAEDIPALHLERSLPQSLSYLPVVVLTSGDWEAYSASISTAVETLGDGGETIRELVAPLLAKPVEQRMVEIRDWVELNVRRTGPAFHNLPLAQLTRPEITARDGYGNSADVAILYAALLRAAGVGKIELFLASNSPQQPALQSFYQKYPFEFTSQWLVRVDGPAGEIWFNDQNRYAQFGTCAYDRGLLLSLKSGKLSSLKLKEGLRSLDRSQLRIDIAPDGSAQITSREVISGSDFGDCKRFYAQLPPEERSRHYQSVLAKFSQNAQPVTPDLNTDFRIYPGEISFTAKIANFATFEGDFCYFTIPVSLGAPLEVAKNNQRYNPLNWPLADSIEEIFITLPANYPKLLLAPADFNWNAPADGGSISWQSTTTTSGKTTMLRFTYRVNTAPTVILPRQFPRLQEALQRLQHPAATTILLGK